MSVDFMMDNASLAVLSVMRIEEQSTLYRSDLDEHNLGLLDNWLSVQVLGMVLVSGCVEALIAHITGGCTRTVPTDSAGNV
jgi:hypothetical protein